MLGQLTAGATTLHSAKIAEKYWLLANYKSSRRQYTIKCLKVLFWMGEEKLRRPDGVAASAVFWFLGGLYAIYDFFNGLNSRLNSVIARAFGVPIEFLIIIVVFVIGFVQVVNAFGLWTGKSYSYWLSLIIPFFAVGVNLALASLYASAPSELNLAISYVPALVNAVGWVIWLFICWWYFGKPYVKAYLGALQKSNMNANFSDSNL